MAARKGADKQSDDPKPDLVVTSVFAYATTTSGEVRQLHKGDAVLTEQYTPESIEHLTSIGFVGKPE